MSAPKHGGWRLRLPNLKMTRRRVLSVFVTVAGLVLGALAGPASASGAPVLKQVDHTVDCTAKPFPTITITVSGTVPAQANMHVVLDFGIVAVADTATDASGDFTISATEPIQETDTTMPWSIVQPPNGQTYLSGTVRFKSCQQRTQPKAAFTDTVNNLVVNFDASGSTGTAPLKYTWDFGDGTTGSGVSPSHTYAKAGTYSVKLTVSNSAGSDSVTHDVTVSKATPPPPTQVTPQSPTHTTPDCTSQTETVTPLAQAGVVWNPSGPTTLQPGQSVTYTATPSAGYAFPAGAQTSWTFTNGLDTTKCSSTPPSSPPPSTPPVTTPPVSPPPSHGGGHSTLPASGGSSSSHHSGSGGDSGSTGGNGGSNQGSGSGGNGTYPVQSPTSGHGASQWDNPYLLAGLALLLLGLALWVNPRERTLFAFLRRSH